SYLPSGNPLDVVSIPPGDRQRLRTCFPSENKLLPFSLTEHSRIFSPSSPLLFVTIDTKSQTQVVFPQVPQLPIGGFVAIGKRQLTVLTPHEADIVKDILRRYQLQVIPFEEVVKSENMFSLYLPNENNSFLWSAMGDTALSRLVVYEIGDRHPYKLVKAVSENDRQLLFELLTAPFAGSDE
ncbi:MAG: hypothetical protein LIP77_00460, partial [Planctomycetes bacterium]|nr:hypothetical protein [Planctomycetota bacterium]